MYVTRFLHSSKELVEKDMGKFKALSGDKKVFMIVESHPHAESPGKEDREFIARKLAEVTKAMAIITPNAVSRMVANLFFLFKPPAFPMKMFVSVSDAKSWLLEYQRKSGRLPVLF